MSATSTGGQVPGVRGPGSAPSRERVAVQLGVGVLAVDKLVRAGLIQTDGKGHMDPRSVAQLAVEHVLATDRLEQVTPAPLLVVQAGPRVDLEPGDWRVSQGWGTNSGAHAVDALRGDWLVPHRREKGEPLWLIATIAGFIVECLRVTGSPTVVGGWCRYPAELVNPEHDAALYTLLGQQDNSRDGRRFRGRLPSKRGPLAWRIDPRER